jgi:hypothetical protein
MAGSQLLFPFVIRNGRENYVIEIGILGMSVAGCPAIGKGVMIAPFPISQPT